MGVKSLIRALSPPILLDAARAARDAIGEPEWEWAPDGFGGGSGPGWEHDSVLESLRARWPRLVEAARGNGPPTFSPEAASPDREDLAAHNTIMVFGYVLARAALGSARLSLLDWGGGLGHYALFARALVPEITIDYHCRDHAALVRAGRSVLPDASFHEDDASCFARGYDLVLSSSSLQYVEDWGALLDRLAGATRRFLLVTRLPVVEHAPSYVAIQRPRRHGFDTEYRGWVINRGELIARARSHDVVLDREFLIGERPRIARAPEPCRYRGFLFRPTAARDA